MATSDKLQKLIDTKESIRQAINQKGGNITTSEPFASYPEYIKNLQTIKQGDYEHNPSAFERIGYTTFPFAATELIDHSEEYRDIVEGNNNNVLIQDKELIYFPVIELNESIDTVTFSASNTSTGVFNTNFPSATVFPPIDFKGRNINAGGSYGIFYNSKNLVEAYLNNAVLNNIQYLFSGCSALIKAEIKDCSSLNGSFARMFYDCSNLKYVTFDNLDTSNATSLTYLFYRCTELINVKGIEDFKTSNVTDMSYTFSQSSYEGNIDLHKWDVSKVTTFRQFISEVNVSNKPSFTSIDLSGWNLEAFNPSTTTSFQIVDGSLKYLDCSDWNLPSATTIPCLVTKADVECELNCPNWNLPKVATLSAATSNTTFQCLDGYYNNIGTGIKRINCSGWQLPIAKILYPVIYSAGVEELDLSDWYVPQATQVTFINTTCTNMKTLNLNNWDFSNFTNISFIGTALNNEFNIIGKFSGIKANLQLQNLRNLTVDSVITVFEALEDISEQSITRSISLYSTVKALLTEEQIAIATSKGWTVS